MHQWLDRCNSSSSNNPGTASSLLNRFFSPAPTRHKVSSTLATQITLHITKQMSISSSSGARSLHVHRMLLQRVSQLGSLRTLAGVNIHHAVHKRLRRLAAHAHRLRPSQVERSHHSRLVRRRRPARIGQRVGQLHEHLNEAIGRAFDSFDGLFAKFVKQQVA